MFSKSLLQAVRMPAVAVEMQRISSLAMGAPPVMETARRKPGGGSLVPKQLGGISSLKQLSTIAIPERHNSDDGVCVVFHGPQDQEKRINNFSVVHRTKPQLQLPTDIVVKMVKTTICGTDLHILGGSVASCDEGRRLGHEGIGEIIEIGDQVSNFKMGDRVLISCITSCRDCYHCSNQFYGHCEDGGWILGHRIDGTQGEFARVPHADGSCYKIPEHFWDTDTEDLLVMCSDILPTGLEVGLLDAGIQEGQSIAVVGVGPVGLASLITSSFYKPKQIFAVDINEHRLEMAQEVGKCTGGLEKTQIIPINNKNLDGAEQVRALTDGIGADLVVEAIGTPAGWYTSQDMVKCGGSIGILGVHVKSATFNLEKMWYRNFRISAGMVHGYTTQMLMDKIMKGEMESSKMLISHKMGMSQLENAYNQFHDAAEHNALKILMTNDLSS